MSEPDSCALQLNPDISGIGVRVAIYVQIGVSLAASMCFPKLRRKISRTIYVTSMALIIASFIQLKTQELNLLDGIIVSLVTTMTACYHYASLIIACYETDDPEPTSSALESSSNNTKPGPTSESNDPRPTSSPFESPNDDRPASVAQDPKKFSKLMKTKFILGEIGYYLAFWGAWCMNLWRNPAQFGLRGDRVNCLTNQNVAVIVFGQAHLAINMRDAALALSIIGFISLYLTLTLDNDLISYLQQTEGDMSFLPIGWSKNVYVRRVYRLVFWLSSLTLICLVIVTEQTITKNDFGNSMNSWTYGQTLALIMLYPLVMGIYENSFDELIVYKNQERIHLRPLRILFGRSITAFLVTKLNPDRKSGAEESDATNLESGQRVGDTTNPGK